LLVTHWAAACHVGAFWGSGKMEKDARDVSSLGGCMITPCRGGADSGVMGWGAPETVGEPAIRSLTSHT
jgi:hypothetical protein